MLIKENGCIMMESGRKGKEQKVGILLFLVEAWERTSVDALRPGAASGVARHSWLAWNLRKSAFIGG